MRRFIIAVISLSIVVGMAGYAAAADTSTTLEEGFINAVGACGPSSNVAGSLGKSEDPAVKLALRDALIIEAADDAAGAPGANAAHSECIKKQLAGAGYDAAQMAALPYCTKHDWPDPFTSLGVCVKNHAKLDAAMGKK